MTKYGRKTDESCSWKTDEISSRKDEISSYYEAFDNESEDYKKLGWESRDAHLRRFGIFVDNAAARGPGNLGAGCYVKIFYYFIVKGHNRENGGHQVQKTAFFRLLERTGESTARHSVLQDSVIKALKG